MKIFTLVQGVALFCAVAVAMSNRSLAAGLVLYVIVQIGYGAPSVAVFIMRRVRNYNKRVAGMEAYRAEVFASQYGTKKPTTTYRAPAREQVYTLR